VVDDQKSVGTPEGGSMSSTTQFAACPASIQTHAGLALGAARLDERGEDRLLVDPEIGLFGVFDGVGGHVDGAAAAELAAATVAAQVRENLAYCRNRRQAHDMLRAALYAADAAIEQYNANRAGTDAAARYGASGATTATVALLWTESSTVVGERSALIAHCGDTRAQLLHAGAFETITLDHAALNDPDPVVAKVRQARLDEATSIGSLRDPLDRAAFAHRHMLSNALTGTGELDVRSYVVTLSPGDRLMLDSDGLHDNLTTGELASLLRAATPQQAADLLAAAADERSHESHEVTARAKPDDISVLVIEPHELRPQPGTTERPTTGSSARPGGPPAVPDTALAEGLGAGVSWLSPGRTARLPLDSGARYLICAADLQIVVVADNGSWWAVQGELPRSGALDAPGCWQLAPGVPLVLGRELPGNFRYPPSPRVSRRHVALTVTDGGTALSVEDLHSTNGTEILAG
jgi:serine/threonine protein phosphatase PrpC